MYKYFLFSLTLILVILSSVSAESLWEDKSKPIFNDNRAAKVGDILTVLIVESASASQNATTDTKKSSSSSLDQGIGSLLNLLKPLSYGGTDSFKGDGKTSRGNSFTASMTVEVKELDKFGNMMIEGKRRVQTNKESANIKLSGKIRPQDISQDNSILSTFISEANISYEGVGPIGSRQKEGLIQRIIGILF